MKNRIIKMFTGVTLASFGSAFVLNSDLGCFVETATFKGLSLELSLPLFLVTMFFELILISIATYNGEGLGWTTIVNATYGAVMINVFHKLLPHTALGVIGALIIPIGWSLLEKAQYGATGSNILMKSLMHKTGKSLFFIRTIIETVYLTLAWIFARQYVSIFSIVLVFTFPVIMTFIYRLIHYKPTSIKHDFIIKRR
jgi:uncharacterized membrane protein YczE